MVKCAGICIEQVAQNSEGRRIFADKVLDLRNRLHSAGVPLRGGHGYDSHIFCVPIESAKRCEKIAEDLLAHGVLVTALLPPVVPEASIGLRINVTTEHTAQMLDDLIRGLRAVGLAGA